MTSTSPAGPSSSVARATVTGWPRSDGRPPRLGYQADHSILEVLVDAGAVWDTEAWWADTSQDCTSDYYAVTFTSEDPIEGGAVNETIAAWTDVPEDYRGT
jgi:hypothetical protein